MVFAERGVPWALRLHRIGVATRRVPGGFVNTFPTSKLRNVALVGHGGAGKTSLAEALLFTAGAIPRLGRVEDHNTTCDFDPEEQRRQISVSLALAPFEHLGHKVNVIDTPGYADFVGEVRAGLRAADCALFVIATSPASMSSLFPNRKYLRRSAGNIIGSTFSLISVNARKLGCANFIVVVF